jgi:hypothetical protein
MAINESIIIIIIIVIIAIIIGMIIRYREFIKGYIGRGDTGAGNKYNFNNLKLKKYSGANDGYSEDISILPYSDITYSDITCLESDSIYSGEYNGGGTKLVIIDDVRNCIDTYNKNGLIDGILNKTFEPLLYVRDISERLPYTKSCSYYTSYHVGQLKLLIGEIHFCTIATELYTSIFTFVYAGSAPNHKGFILNKLFPNMKAILVDPAEHLLYKSNNMNHYNAPNNNVLYFCCSNTNKFNINNRIVHIFDGSKIQKLSRDSAEVKIISDKWRAGTTIDDEYLNIVKKIIAGEIGYDTYNNIIIEDYFKDDTAEFCAKIPNIIFASDIRTNAHDMLKLNTFGKRDVTDLDICVNSAMMLSWVNIMKPRLTMLKFRPPYYMFKERDIFNKYCNTGIYKYYFDKVKYQVDFVSDYNKKEFRYILGDEVIQAYAGTTSGETRLIFKNVEIGLYDHIKREEQLFYYNQIRRQYGFHISVIDPIAGIDHCGDCALAQKIISDYISKYKITNPNITLNNMVSLLRRALNIDTHGAFISMNYNIDSVYNIQGYILLNTFMKNLYKRMIPRPIDINIEKRYQLKKVLNISSIVMDLTTKYIVSGKDFDVPGFKFLLMKYLSYRSMWQDKSIIYEYIYYDLTSKRGLAAGSAQQLLSILSDLYDKIHNGDYSNKSDIEIITNEKTITLKYRDYSIEISKNWYFIDDLMTKKDIYLNSIMYDARVTAGNFITIPDIIYTIIDLIGYDNLYELSLGLHDMCFNNSSANINMNIEHFTHIECGIKTSDNLISNKIPPKTIIFGYYQASSLFSSYLMHLIHNTHSDTIIIFVTLDNIYSKSYIKKGYRIQTPYNGVNLMKMPVKTYITLIGFHFIGPPEKLYTIKSYYERTI